MSVAIDIQYPGGLHCLAKHAPSGNTVTTDAPTDNGGKGEAFSPTDLVAAALGACAITVMDLVARRRGWDMAGTRVHVVKEMAAQPVRRIGTVRVTLTMPASLKLGAEDRNLLEQAAKKCPVLQSLHPDVQVVTTFEWQ
jgi:putative redox protein